MAKRFVSIWFPFLKANWMAKRHARLKDLPFALMMPSRGRMIITAVNRLAMQQGVTIGMAVADARAILPSLEVLDEEPALAERLLRNIATWCIRFTPSSAANLPDGILLDSTGCAHLWGGEENYLSKIISQLEDAGYQVQASMADTIGTAWAISRFGGRKAAIIPPGEQYAAISELPPESLRIDQSINERLHKLGLTKVKSFMSMPRQALRRRFGQQLLDRLDQALGQQIELVDPIVPPEPYHERLPCLEPVRTAPAIENALRRLLEQLCARLQNEGAGVRQAVFKGFRIDGKVEQVAIGTNRASSNVDHLFQLFCLKTGTIEPDLGIEVFVLDATLVEDARPKQDKLWEIPSGLADQRLSEFIDRLEGRLGTGIVHRYLPQEYYWPERSIKLAGSLTEGPTTEWRTDIPRPTILLKKPEHIEVTVPLPDYPPMHFRYNGKLHKVVAANGPERIKREWWIEGGQPRDYYQVEDEEGKRFWIFRLGQYSDEHTPSWFVHGLFA